jgi:hypothetical protein
MKLDYEPASRRSGPIGALIIGSVLFGYLSLSFGLIVYEELQHREWLSAGAYGIYFILSFAALGLSARRIVHSRRQPHA